MLAQYPRAMAVVCSVLTGAWIYFASTWLVWVYQVAFCGSIGLGLLLHRNLNSGSATQAAIFTLPTIVVGWFWLAVSPDRDFGYMAQIFATAHLVLILLAFFAARFIQRRPRGV